VVPARRRERGIVGRDARLLRSAVPVRVRVLTARGFGDLGAAVATLIYRRASRATVSPAIGSATARG